MADLARGCNNCRVRHVLNPLWTDERADALAGAVDMMSLMSLQIEFPATWKRFCRSLDFRLRMFVIVSSCVHTPHAACNWPPLDINGADGRVRWLVALAFAKGIPETSVAREVRVPAGFVLGRGSAGVGNNCFVSTCFQLLQPEARVTACVWQACPWCVLRVGGGTHCFCVLLCAWVCVFARVCVCVLQSER